MKQAATNIYRNDQIETTDFHGASIINEFGEEIPITENMLQQSFMKLIRAWEQDRRKYSPRRTFQFFR